MKELYGSLSGISKKHLHDLEQLYQYSLPPGQIGDEWLCHEIIKKTKAINKEIALYINRSGQIVMVAIGKRHSASIPVISEKRSAEGMKRLGCLHSHPCDNSLLSSEDLQTLQNLELDFMCAIAESDTDIIASVAFLSDNYATNKDFEPDIRNFLSLESLLAIPYLEIIKKIEKQTSRDSVHATTTDKEKALLFIPFSNIGEEELLEQVEEFKNLASSAGLDIAEVVTQNIKQSKSVIGKGKLDEIRSLIHKHHPDCLLIDSTVSPSQENAIAEDLGIKVIDRTNLILDIFAQRAKSNEGKLQVELAQLKYLLPRIMGQGLSLSRLGGGVGTRGPGETQLETDRRHIRRRITTLEKQLETVKKRRTIQKQNRIKKELPLVSLVGYTNSGKSSLLNALCSDKVFAEDLLFATLDTTTRALQLKESGNTVLLTDTVGFISHLPHQLVSAFKSTLEEVLEADLLLHVIDISNSNWQHHIAIVEKIFSEMGVLDKDMMYIFNKSDLILPEEIPILIDKPHLFVSAKTGLGLDILQQKIDHHFFEKKIITILLPYSEAKLLATAHREGEILKTEHLEEGSLLTLSVNSAKVDLFKKYLIK